MINSEVVIASHYLYISIFDVINLEILSGATHPFTLISPVQVSKALLITVITRLTKIICSGITFVSRNLRYPKRDFP